MASALSPNLPWNLANPIWAASLNPLLANPLNNLQIIKGIKLIDGNTTVAHGLGRVMQGWLQLDIDAPATYYRSAPFNSKNITFTSNAVATISIGVF